ncbi:hypothetical protein BTA51_19200 [Hahella sp. CCB-MM4]|uniref:hypothetical protein n=1 Tax=Hahella sp. (strain CCB-MM4) TaxID=1926491 RepID=UPI000B9C1D70|nr:hypothetical protein [Hahella sp. CCB-MM4]OZG71765.1 hypothetical protein BTA51_19200 [Hahella sp. CCB-MM4]
MQNSNLPAQHDLIPFENPLPSWGASQKATGKKLMITKEADSDLRRLNTYEKTLAYNAACTLVSEGGYGLGSAGFFKSPMFMRFKKFKGGVGLRYSSNPEMLIVNQVELKRELTDLDTPNNKQQMGLFEIKRESGMRWHETSSHEDVQELQKAWSRPVRVHRIGTEHVAINGMLNNLDKARWLMGVHMDTAYWEDYAKAYTLIHNPTRGWLPDFFECLQDKLGTSKLAQFVAVMLLESQQKGEKRKWTAHSQGGIILTRAVELVNQRGVRLEGQRVSIHAGGNDKERAESAFKQAGMTIDNITRDHPFDPVPNLAGGNNVSRSSIGHGLGNLGLVAGSSSPVETSPHTLPFLSAECSIRHLQMNGYHKKAEKLALQVMKDMDLV